MGVRSRSRRRASRRGRPPCRRCLPPRARTPGPAGIPRRGPWTRPPDDAWSQADRMAWDEEPLPVTRRWTASPPLSDQCGRRSSSCTGPARQRPVRRRVPADRHRLAAVLAPRRARRRHRRGRRRLLARVATRRLRALGDDAAEWSQRWSVRSRSASRRCGCSVGGMRPRRTGTGTSSTRWSDGLEARGGAATCLQAGGGCVRRRGRRSSGDARRGAGSALRKRARPTSHRDARGVHHEAGRLCDVGHGRPPSAKSSASIGSAAADRTTSSRSAAPHHGTVRSSYRRVMRSNAVDRWWATASDQRVSGAIASTRIQRGALALRAASGSGPQNGRVPRPRLLALAIGLFAVLAFVFVIEPHPTSPNRSHEQQHPAALRRRSGWRSSATR